MHSLKWVVVVLSVSKAVSLLSQLGSFMCYIAVIPEQCPLTLMWLFCSVLIDCAEPCICTVQHVSLFMVDCLFVQGHHWRCVHQPQHHCQLAVSQVCLLLLHRTVMHRATRRHNMSSAHWWYSAPLYQRHFLSALAVCLEVCQSTTIQQLFDGFPWNIHSWSLENESSWPFICEVG